MMMRMGRGPRCHGNINNISSINWHKLAAGWRHIQYVSNYFCEAPTHAWSREPFSIRDEQFPTLVRFSTARECCLPVIATVCPSFCLSVTRWYCFDRITLRG